MDTNNTTFTIEEYHDLLSVAKNGKETMALHKKAWETIPQYQDRMNQIRLRLAYVHDSCFYDDCMMALVVFPQILKMYDEDLAEFGSCSQESSIMWDYKWILGNAPEFYQISDKQFHIFCEDFKRRCTAIGYSLRSYHQFLYQYYIEVDSEKAMEHYKLFKKCKRDDLSDCHACERDTEVKFCLDNNDLEQAQELARILFNRSLTCVEIPEGTMGDFIRFYNFHPEQEEDPENTRELVISLTNAIRKKNICTEYCGDILMYYARTNPANALPFFKKHVSYLEQCNNPRTKFYFCLGAYTFFRSIGKEKYRMKLPNDFPLYQPSGTYVIADLLDYYKKEFESIAQKMDARNQTSLYADRCTYIQNLEF